MTYDHPNPTPKVPHRHLRNPAGSALRTSRVRGPAATLAD